jgi:hypothetical protein
MIKWGDLWGDSDFERNLDSETLANGRPMDRAMTWVNCKWWGACLSKYQWVSVLSLLVREIGYLARTFRTIWRLNLDTINPDSSHHVRNRKGIGTLKGDYICICHYYHFLNFLIISFICFQWASKRISVFSTATINQSRTVPISDARTLVVDDILPKHVRMSFQRWANLCSHVAALPEQTFPSQLHSRIASRIFGICFANPTWSLGCRISPFYGILIILFMASLSWSFQLFPEFFKILHYTIIRHWNSHEHNWYFMRRPRLMKLSRTKIDGNCLPSDVVSIVLPWLAFWIRCIQPWNKLFNSWWSRPPQSLLATQKIGRHQPPESVWALLWL